MERQSTEDEGDGMTRWFESEYGGDGFKAHRISENRTRLRLPKQADNIGELIARAHEEHGAICDLSLDKDGRSELTFWSVPQEKADDDGEDLEEGATPFARAARICQAIALILLFVAAADYFLTPRL